MPWEAPTKRKERYVLLAIAALFATCAARCGVAFHRGGQASDLAVDAFHARYDAERYAEIYALASDELQAVQSEQGFVAFLASVHRPLGKVTNRERVGTNVHVALSGTTTTGATYHTHFAGGQAVETFAWRSSLVGEPRLVGYHITSHELLLK